jgi:hypothetical protein
MKLPIISKLIPNFGNQILPNFAKLQNPEFSAFCRALIVNALLQHAFIHQIYELWFTFFTLVLFLQGENVKLNPLPKLI